MAERARSFLLVPAGGAGEGMGHLARCLRLATRLGPRVTFLTSHLDAGARTFLEQRVRRWRNAHARPALLASPEGRLRWDVVLVDRRRTSRPALEFLARHGTVICVDEGGEARDFAPFLVDTLPNPMTRSAANVASPSLNDLPPRARRKVRSPARKVLLSFGGEDREDLAGRLAAALLRERIFPEARVTVVEGPLSARRTWPEGIEIIRGVAGLREILAQFDLVFTHFGLTAYEALAAGVPVVLLNPTAYHRDLGVAAGMPEIGVGEPDLRLLRRLRDDPRALGDPVNRLNRELGAAREGRLAELLLSLDLASRSSCPVCAAAGNTAVARFPERTYWRCARCGIDYLQGFSAARTEYGRGYFFSEYRAQYGRTYLEDFSAIKEACRPRVQTIARLLDGRGAGALVDVGCAYGPFLDAARDAGLPCFGIDVSADAVAYVRKRLGIPAARASFEMAGRRLLPRRILAISFWYVIEHFRDTDMALRKAAALLPRGGVLAFSTPNGRGISARKDLREFLRQSPTDHFTIFSPRGLRALLAGHGFDLKVVRVTGHHPERFPGALGKAARASRAGFLVLRAASRLLGLGDTFEAYCVKGETG